MTRDEILKNAAPDFPKDAAKLFLNKNAYSPLVGAERNGL